MYITDNSLDPASKFEDLARFTFDNCKKYGDPWGYAAQEVYSNFISKVDLKGKRILSTILSILIYKYSKTNIIDKLIIIEESIWKASEQKDAIAIIIGTIRELEKLKD